MGKKREKDAIVPYVELPVANLDCRRTSRWRIRKLRRRGRQPGLDQPTSCDGKALKQCLGLDERLTADAVGDVIALVQ